MEKIPTLFERTEDRRHVIDQVVPGCEWVLQGQGKATRKWDGTCVMFDGRDWWARREVKPDATPPPGWVQTAGVDEATGKSIGWEPAAQSSFAKYLAQAVAVAVADRDEWEQGTYELVGPKINGNPEQMGANTLLPHGSVELRRPPLTFSGLRSYLTVENPHIEGIVWWHPDGRRAKIKRRDFPR